MYVILNLGEIMNTSIKNILIKIEELGYEAYVVGGFVRDSIWKIDSKDVDICTNAPADKLLDLFKEYKPKELKYHTLKFKYNSYNIDIAQLRSEKYKNNNLIVSFNASLKEDYERRDFTFNAIYIDAYDQITSFDSSLDDCINKRIKFIGNSSNKIKEDGSRLLRYIYFVLKYDLNYEKVNFDIDNFKLFFNNPLNKQIIDTLINRIIKFNQNDKFIKILDEFGINDLFIL